MLVIWETTCSEMLPPTNHTDKGTICVKEEATAGAQFLQPIKAYNLARDSMTSATWKP